MTSDPRASSRGQQLELGDRDRALLMAVGSLRFMTGGQLQGLFFNPDSGYGSDNPRIARRTLQRLTDHGLLLRLERRVGGVRAGSSSYLYALSPRGGRLIGLPVGRGRRREPSLTFVRHTLAIADVAVQLQLARQAGQLEALQLQLEPACWRDLGGMDGVWLKPDLFVLAATSEHEHLAFVEVDNGSEHGPALLRKAWLYERYFRSGREQARHGTFPRVLWLAPDAARVQRLSSVLQEDRRLTGALHRVGLQAEPLAELLGRESTHN